MNSDLMKSFAKQINLKTGEIESPSNLWTRHLKDMSEMYQNQKAVSEILQSNDPLLYEVYEIAVPEETGHLIQCTSIVYPGKVGNEYYMTKGHFHQKRGTAEIYLCLAGHGYLLTQTEKGRGDALEVKPGTSTYVSPYWAHRMVNVGNEPFVFFGVYPADAGHDYGSIEEVGFPQLVMEENGKPIIKENPLFQS